MKAKTIQEILASLKKLEQYVPNRTVYYVFWFGECVEIFNAKSTLAAKRKTSKFCNSDADLYKADCVCLKDWNGEDVGVYSPREGKWY